jgi:hypothetical protein
MPEILIIRDGSGFHGYMSSSRGDQVHLGLRSPSSNNNSLMLQDPHDPNHQFLSNLGLELLSSPTSPSGGFRSSSLLRSLTEPSAAATKPSLGFQQYQQQTMNQAPSSIREALQFTNSTPFWNPSSGFAAAAAAEGAASLGTAAGPPSGQSKSRPASLAAKVHIYSKHNIAYIDDCSFPYFQLSENLYLFISCIQL